MLDYEEAKRFFHEKLGNDHFGQGRMESAFYHTAQWIWLHGHREGVLEAVQKVEEGVPTEDIRNSL
jgi:hypothetical protein